MKRILFIVQSVYDTDPRVRRKAEALFCAGWSVDVIALQPSWQKNKEYELDGVRVFCVPLSKKRASRLRYLWEYGTFFLSSCRMAKRLGKQNKYAVVDVNTLPDFLVFSAKALKRKGSVVILDMHEMMPEFYMSKFRVKNDHLVIRFLLMLEKAAFSYADHVLLIHDPMKELFNERKLDVTKTTVIMNSVDPERVKMPEAKQPRPEECRFLICYHGTLTHLYGLDIAIDAFARALPQMPGSHFWILGDGPCRDDLKSQISRLNLSDNVHLLGVVPQERVTEWVLACDAGVLPTRKDLYADLSFSNKLSEYVLFKKPVIASRLMTTERYFSDDALAYFEPENADNLASKMIELYRSQDQRQRLAHQAYEEYQPIRWEVMRERYLDLMGKLCT